MTRVALNGCRTEPLGSYLQGLGLFRAVATQADNDARCCWRHDVLVLDSSLDRDDLVAFMTGTFVFSPLVSPWNKDAGFFTPGHYTELVQVRDSADSRVAQLGAAVSTAERTAAAWVGAGRPDPTGKVLLKDHFVMECRNTWSDDMLTWLDVAIVIGEDGSLRYNSLVGTGGNLGGRQELSKQYVRAVWDLTGKKGAHQRSASWLSDALCGTGTAKFQRGSVGQFDPGRAGGPQGSSLGISDRDGFSNPWSLVLTLEGALLFAGALVRRAGAASARAATPFVVQGSAAGFATSAEGERVEAEVWTPEWGRPASLADVEALMAEGRADWNGRAASDGMSFARAVATLHVDRSVDRFGRHVVMMRLGPSPIAVTVGHVDVTERRDVTLTAVLDRWLRGLRGLANAHRGIDSAVRAVDDATFDLATRGGTEASRRLLVALGELHARVEVSRRARESCGGPLVMPAAGWLDALDVGASAEWRLAVGFASLRDERFGPGGGIRTGLTAVEPDTQKRLDWGDPPAHPLTSGSHLARALADSLRRHGLGMLRPVPREGAVSASADRVVPAVRGSDPSYAFGVRTGIDDVEAYCNGDIDDEDLLSRLRGLLLLDWSGDEGRLREGPRGPGTMDPVVALLLPFFAGGSLVVPVVGDDGDAREKEILLLPGTEWIPLLVAGHVGRVAEDAVRRLRIAGLPVVVDAELAAAGWRGRSDRLAAALLLRVPRRGRVAALARTCRMEPVRETRHRAPEGAVQEDDSDD